MCPTTKDLNVRSPLHAGIPFYLPIAPSAAKFHRLMAQSSSYPVSTQNFTLFFPKELLPFKGQLEQISYQCYT